MKWAVPLLAVLIFFSGCLCCQSSLGGGDYDDLHSGMPELDRKPVNPSTGLGGKPGGAGHVASPIKPGSLEECQGICDWECANDMTFCQQQCEGQHDSTCQDASQLLLSCNFACQFLPIPPGPGPNPRVACFDKCMDSFENACSNSQLPSCLNSCTSEYHVCQKDCYGDC
jgi:hypothetical protein